jgi:CRISPR-associated protein Cas2
MIDPLEYDGTIVNDFTRYRVGYSTAAYDPAQKEYRDMLYMVAYDIADPKRLRKVAKVCEDFGIRVEYSVFECDLSDDDFESLWTALNAEIDEEEDCVLAYRICGSCVRKIESMGAVVRPSERPLLYMP